MVALVVLFCRLTFPNILITKMSGSIGHKQTKMSVSECSDLIFKDVIRDIISDVVVKRSEGVCCRRKHTQESL